MIELRVVPLQNLSQYYAIKIGGRLVTFDPDSEESFIACHKKVMAITSDVTIYDNTLDWAINQFGKQILDKI